MLGTQFLSGMGKEGKDKKRKKDNKDGKKKSKKSKQDVEKTPEELMKSDTALAMIRFRNYVPRDKLLRVFCLANPVVEHTLDVAALAKPLSETVRRHGVSYALGGNIEPC